jgi:probable rRNA maturation factor
MPPSGRAARRRLAVAVTDDTGRPVADAGLARWLVRHAPRGAHGHVAIALVSDAQMRALNARYRGKRAPTDVLSFGGRTAVRSRAAIGGDLAIARGVARGQARQAGHAYATELRILALHGLLHLLGYDHETDRGQMARLEDRLRRQAGLPSGLIGRPAGRRRAR